MVKLKVVNYEFFTFSSQRGLVESTGVNLLLEDGRVFTMFNIPKFIAIECLRLKESLMDDYRMSLGEVLSDLPDLEKAVSDSIESVIIDTLDKERDIYAATIIKKNGMHKELKMIPSHAILLSLIAGIDLYVEESLVSEQERRAQRDYMEKFP